MGGIVDKRLPGRAFDDKERGILREPVGGAQHASGSQVRRAPPINYRNMPFTAQARDVGGSLAVLPDNPTRVYLNVQNQGSVDIFVSFGSANGGMIIVPGNGFEWNQNAPQNSLYVYTGGGAATCILIEGVR